HASKTQNRGTARSADPVKHSHENRQANLSRVVEVQLHKIPNLCCIRPPEPTSIQKKCRSVFALLQSTRHVACCVIRERNGQQTKANVSSRPILDSVSAKPAEATQSHVHCATDRESPPGETLN